MLDWNADWTDFFRSLSNKESYVYSGNLMIMKRKKIRPEQLSSRVQKLRGIIKIDKEVISVDEIIKKYSNRLEKLRTNEAEFEKYRFKLSGDGKIDVNRFNRFSIGVGLFNDLRIPNDYSLVKKLFQEEKKHRDAQTSDYEFETIYMYSYFLSEFGKLEDIWEFAALKFDGSMDADCGFDTGFFLTYGRENLKQYLENSTHILKNKIEKKVFEHEADYSDEDGIFYKESQISYFDFKKPVSNPLQFYKSLGLNKRLK